VSPGPPAVRGGVEAHPLLGNPETLTGRLLAELGVTTRWVKMDPVDTFHFPDGTRRVAGLVAGGLAGAAAGAASRPPSARDSRPERAARPAWRRTSRENDL